MENQNRTLEQLIGAYCDGRPLEADVGLSIAAAVREWMREQNEGLRGALTEAVSSGQRTQEIVDAILSVIPPRNQDDEILVGWANKRIEILERENANLRKRLPDPVTLQTEMEKWQASRIKELEEELQSYKDLWTREDSVRKELEAQCIQLDEELSWFKGENSALRVRLEEERKRLDMSVRCPAREVSIPAGRGILDTVPELGDEVDRRKGLVQQ